jgi:plasmid replication initiation protein
MTTKKAIEKAKTYDAAKPERPPGERWVTMTNALARAGQGLTLAEKRIVAAAVAKLDSKRVILPGEEFASKLTAAEYAETYGVDMRTAYEALKDAAKHLYSRSIVFFRPAHKREGKPITPPKVIMRWVYKIEYHDNEGRVSLFWSPDVRNHLTGLQKQFTTYQLKQASALRSVYSWRLLELLMRFKSTCHAEYTIEDFCASMDAPEKHRADFAKIRTKIIEPAVKELIEKDGWLIQWKPVKAGRKVKALRFSFMKNPQQQFPFE